MSWTQLICSLVAGLAVAYAVEEARRIRGKRLFRLVTRGQAIRRVIGSLLVAVLMLLVYLGLEIVSPYERMRPYVLVWLGVCVVLAILLALAALDLRELRANRDIERARELVGLASRRRRGRPDEETEPGPGDEKG